jgi:hypothetical protein
MFNRKTITEMQVFHDQRSVETCRCCIIKMVREHVWIETTDESREHEEEPALEGSPGNIYIFIFIFMYYMYMQT